MVDFSDCRNRFGSRLDIDSQCVLVEFVGSVWLLLVLVNQGIV